MRRAIAFCHARSDWWRERAPAAAAEPAALQEGLRAYALAMADAETQLADLSTGRWRPLQDEAQEFMQQHPLYDDNGMIAMGGGADDDDDGDEDTISLFDSVVIVLR